MDLLRRLVAWADRWQRRHAIAAVPYAVVKKFGDDNANLLVVSLAWYGFTAIFPLLLIVVTVLGFVGQRSLGSTFLSTLHEFPVIGDSFNPARNSHLHGSTVGLVVGLLGLLYGAQGVTQTAQLAMASVWDVPELDRAGFLPRLGRSFAGLLIIGGSFLVNAVITGYITRPGESWLLRVPVSAGLLVLNIALYWTSFVVLTHAEIRKSALLPGAIVGGTAFTALITVGTGLVSHQLRSASNTYGTFGSVIGVVTFLLLLAKLSLYAAELNPVLDRQLYPRALPLGDMTTADRRVHRALIHEQRRSTDEHIGVGFAPDPIEQATDELRRSTTD
ncbi:MAG: YihY/virulence factor BrkB family protein [Actinobacteria bacterium]|nr:YihY/virulence factor BrkB family protein [Actinomycetota bacterium]